MAKQQTGSYISSPKTKRPDVHSKCRSSKHKMSKNYRKKYRGQGR